MRKAGGRPCREELERCQQSEGERALGPRHIAVEQDRRERRPQGDGHHQVEGVELRQGPLARQAEHEDDGDVGGRAHGEHPAEVGP